MGKIFQWRKLDRKEKRYLHKSLTDKYLCLEKENKINKKNNNIKYKKLL
jgi:hypothetical protein